MKAKWPKKVPSLTRAEQEIKNDFMKYWHEVLPRRYSVVEKFNHGFPVKYATGRRVLEIGAGLGEHIGYENLNAVDYYAMELRPEMAEVIKNRFPNVQVIVGDCQKHSSFPDHYFDRIIAIHVLEHLPNLPEALREVRRVLKTDGKFLIVIPCEGGTLYSFARFISAKRIFKKRYGEDYDWYIKTEHINLPDEIEEELKHYFTINKRSYFPFLIPSVQANLVIGLECAPRV